MSSIAKQYWSRGDRFLTLLITLVATLLLLSTIESPTLQKKLGDVCFSLVFVAGVLANRRRKVIFWMAIVLGLVALCLIWGRWIIGDSALYVPRLISDIVFFTFTAAMILVAVFKDHMATMQAVFGAICVYLLLGIAWAFGYLLIESCEQEPFLFVERRIEQPMLEGREATDLSQMVYYSFVTMTTLGYGDITPRTRLAQTVTWMQAVTGQLFVAVLIARLVTELPRYSRGQ